MTSMVQNVRYALRQLRKNPGFAAIAVLTLALGIGPNVAIFSVIWGTFLAPLPYPEGDRLVVVWTKINGERDASRADDYVQYLSQSKSFERLDFGPWVTLHLTDPDPSEEPIQGGFAMPGFFSKTLREHMAMGRDFLPEEGIPGNDRVALITDRLWMGRFHGDPNILGKKIPIEGQPYTVVGVFEPAVTDRGSGSFDVPFALTPGRHDPRGGNIFGRLKPGVTLGQAQAELSVIDQRLAATRGGNLPPDAWTIGVEPLKNDWLDKKLERNLWLLLAAVGFVLLIACVNVANLLLARGTARQREIALRAAIGASRWQVFAQLLTESLTLAILGCAVGVGLGATLLKFVVATLPGLFDQVSEADIRLNVPVLVFAAGTSLVAGVLFGCAPAWRAAKLNLTEALNQGSQSMMGGRRSRTQAVLVAAEFSLAITLLAGAGMAMHSYWKLTSIDLGFRTTHILMARIQRPSTEHPNPDQIIADTRQLLDKLRAVPGVRNASMSTGMPLDGGGSSPFRIAGQPVSEPRVADFESVTPGFFDTFGVRLLKGRLLNDSDLTGSTRVVVVSDGFVQRFLPNVDPLTQRLVTSRPMPDQKLGPDEVEWQIVGVFHEIRNGQHITDAAQPEVYTSFWQAPFKNAGIAVRTALDPGLVSKSMRAVVVRADPTLLLSHMETIEDRVDDDFKGDRFGVVLFGTFAALALLLAALGVYGVMAFAVAQRRHEIGLRMALGAQRDEVVKMIVADGLKLALSGVAIGLVGVYGLGRLMRSTLYGIQTVDLKSFAAVSLVLVAAAVIASYVPARRSAKVDPMVALRCE